MDTFKESFSSALSAGQKYVQIEYVYTTALRNKCASYADARSEDPCAFCRYLKETGGKLTNMQLKV